MSKQMNIRFGVLVLLIFLAALSRLLPHPYNFTPVGAMGLFGAAYFSQRYLAFLVPFAAKWASDLLLNNVIYAKQFPEYYNGFVWFSDAWVYLGFALIVILGFLLLQKVNVKNIFLASIAASFIFYLVTNFGVWLGSAAYPQNAIGLLTCYAAGLPFYSMEAAPPLGFLGNGILGDLFYCAVLFGLYEIVQTRVLGATKVAMNNDILDN